MLKYLAISVVFMAGCSSTQLPPVPSYGGDRDFTPSIGRLTEVHERTLTVNIGTRNGLDVGDICYIHRSDVLIGMAVATEVSEDTSVLAWSHQKDSHKPQVGDVTQWLIGKATE